MRGLVSVVGDGDVGHDLLAKARRDGIDVRHVVTRQGAETGLIVEALEPNGDWRYLQHLPEPVLVTRGRHRDVGRGVPPGVGRAAAAAAVAAARIARDGDALVVCDGDRPTTRHGTRCWR